MPLKIALPVDDSGRPNFSEAYVDGGAGRVAATDRFVATAPQAGAPLEVTVGALDNSSPASHVRVPLHAAPPPPHGPDGKYKMQAIASDSGVMAINGSFDGDSDSSAIAVNDAPATIVAESSDTAYFVLPPATHSGRNRVVLSQDDRSVGFELFQADIGISATRTTLEQGEKRRVQSHRNGIGRDA